MKALLPAGTPVQHKTGTLAGYTSDGRLARHGLVVLEDDRRFFPPYDAAIVWRPDLARKCEAAPAALSPHLALRDDPTTLFAGEASNLCDECVETLAEIVADARTRETAATGGRVADRQCSAVTVGHGDTNTTGA